MASATLFAYVLSPQLLDVFRPETVLRVWDELASRGVNYLFFLAVSMLHDLRDKLLLMDLNETLAFINNVASAIDSFLPNADLLNLERVFEFAHKVAQHTPTSFICADFIDYTDPKELVGHVATN